MKQYFRIKHAFCIMSWDWQHSNNQQKLSSLRMSMKGFESSAGGHVWKRASLNNFRTKHGNNEKSTIPAAVWNGYAKHCNFSHCDWTWRLKNKHVLKYCKIYRGKDDIGIRSMAHKSVRGISVNRSEPAERNNRK